jgi:hypothetical protein
VIRLSDWQIIEYFQRSYKAVDGLWFVNCEERWGFEEALNVDDAVWEAMPKIQARKMKEFAGLEEGLDALFQCFTTRLRLEGFAFDACKDDDGRSFTITITECPWQNLMAQAGRQHLAGRIGDRICNTECRVWATEFGGNISFAFGERICHGQGTCIMQFREAAQSQE